MNIPDCYDPIYQAERREMNADRKMETFPVCCICDRHIQDGVYFKHLDRCVCESCFDELENNVQMEVYW